MDARTEQTHTLDTGVEQIRFAHGKRLDGLHELGITSIRDLLEHYPFRYDDFSKVMRIIDLPLGKKNAVLGRIHAAKGRRSSKGGYLYEITVTDSSGMIKAVWFNQNWLTETLTVGKDILLLGKVEHYGGFLNMASPLYSLVTTEQPPPENESGDKQIQNIDAGSSPVGIVPVYRATGKISSNWIKRLVLETRKLVLEPLDPLPPSLRIKRNLMSRQIAWYNIHTPISEEELRQAHKRLAYEQVFLTHLRFAYAETKRQQGLRSFEHHREGSLLDKLSGLLPFELSDSQKSAVSEILTDMHEPQRMNRLLLGDVGSGKTVVALFALVAAVQSGWQAVMMAPTEILANQYSQAVGSFLDRLDISWTLLSSSMRVGTRMTEYGRITTGDVQVVFGTHALIEPGVVFKELSLIIIDEQHRFGVEHRNSLIAKSPMADFLSMTATPIPRSLALVLYGTITASYLQNRSQKAKTTTVNIDSSVAYKAYEAIREALRKGEQAYIVCPLISAPRMEEGEEDEIQYLDDLEGFVDEPSIAAAEAELKHLRTQVFPERTIELLTSRVKSEEKQRIMLGFRSGEVDILVSTTVIEVGIDVPNATIMVILDADRFGLAQLHQLRGRVGRGTKNATVFLVSHNPGEKARKRLRLLEQNTDGLKLAEADLAERREGDIAGTRQHGDSSLSLINVIRDSALIEIAHEDVLSLLKQDEALSHPEHQHLRYELSHEKSVSTD